MREIFKSKIMLLFIAFVLGVSYINSSSLSNLESVSNKDEVVINVK